MGGFGIRGIGPGPAAEVGVTAVIGTEGDKIRSKMTAYAEGFVGGGFALGRGPWAGLWTGDVSDLDCSTQEVGIDTPFFSISILFDMT